jgi:1,4-dihydroxy-2-naphthoate octaprenyltransferase
MLSVRREQKTGKAAMGWQMLVGLYRMARPAQLSVICLVYGMGVLLGLAHGTPADGVDIIVGFAALFPAALSVHFVNEYADYETDMLTERTPFSGGSGALTELPLPRRLPRDAARITVGLSLAVVVLAELGGVGLSRTALSLLGSILVLGWWYSVGPKFAWNGLGELDNALVGGVLLPLYGVAIVAGTVSLTGLLAVLPFGVAVFVNLLATTWPDRAADAAVEKETLATRWAPRRLRGLYTAALVVYVVLVLGLWGGPLPLPVAVASLVTVPLFGYGLATYTRRESPAPTVVAMVTLAVAQTAGWLWLVW